MEIIELITYLKLFDLSLMLLAAMVILVQYNRHQRLEDITRCIEQYHKKKAVVELSKYELGQTVKLTRRSEELYLYARNYVYVITEVIGHVGYVTYKITSKIGKQYVLYDEFKDNELMSIKKRKQRG